MKSIRTRIDPCETALLIAMLADVVRRLGPDADPADFELVVRYAGEPGVITTMVLPPSVRPVA